MSFEEYLANAKNGSRSAYDSLCARFADKLYTAALVALKNSSDAENAVISAADDGYKGIARIKDERHLCSWLVHELTKSTVDILKEYKASGTVHTAHGELAGTEKMPDVERLVFAVSAVFGYSDREISVLLGMPENIVADKLSSAKSHLGSGYDTVLRAIASTYAPESLIKHFAAQVEERSLADVLHITAHESADDEPQPAEQEEDADGPYSPEVAASLYEETMELDISTDDTGEVQPESAEPEQEAEPQLGAPENAEEDQPEEPAEADIVPETVQPVEDEEAEIPSDLPEETEPAEVYEEEPEEDEESAPEEQFVVQEQPEPETDDNADIPEENAVQPVDVPEEETEEKQEDESVFAEESESNETADDTSENYVETETEEYETEDIPEDVEEDDLSGYKFDAATFIAVVSSERMKGSEFLRLIGNTRISNSVYREIEQNPKLTKSRLIELLEQSPLTENDYYKMLTAIKDRREVLDAKEENRLALEKAGLYDGSRRQKRRRRKTPKTDLQMAIGMNDPSHTAPITFEQQKDSEAAGDGEQYRPGYEMPPTAGSRAVPVQPAVPTAPGVLPPDTDYFPEGQDRYNGKRSRSRKNSGRRANGEPEDGSASGVTPSLGDIVSDVPRKEADPIFSTDYSDIDDPYSEAVDPFAAIAANETGVQSKPEKITSPEFRYEDDAGDITTDQTFEPSTAEENDVFKEVQTEEPETAASEEIPEENDAGSGYVQEETEYPEEPVTADGAASPDDDTAEEIPQSNVKSGEGAHGTIEFDLPLTSIVDTRTFDKIIPIPFVDESDDEEAVPEKPSEPLLSGTDYPYNNSVPLPGIKVEKPEDDIQPFRVELPDMSADTDDEPDYDDFDSMEFPDRNEEPETPEETEPVWEEEPIVTEEEPEPPEEEIQAEEEPELAVEEDIPDSEEEPELLSEDEPEFEEEEEPEPVKPEKKRPDLSVTQIISDYAIGESDPYVNHIVDPEDDELFGYSPDVDLIFAGEKKSGGNDETLEFTADAAADEDLYEEDEEESIELPYEVDDVSSDEPDTSAEYEEELYEEPAEKAEESYHGYHSEERPSPEQEEPEEDFGRSRYKGNEYFYDDNKYYEGVNNGKIIACAVCAVLLTAGSVGMKLVGKPTDSVPDTQPAVTQEVVSVQDTSAEEETPVRENETSFSEKAELIKLSSYDRLNDAVYEGSYRSSKRSAEAGYMRASGTPYAPQILPGSEAGVLTDGDTAYIYTNDYFRKVSLAAGGDTPAFQPDPVRVDGSAVYGYTVINGDLYVISEVRDAAGASMHETAVTVYDSTLSKKDEYTVTGDYAGAGIADGKLVVAAVYAPDKADSLYGGKKPSFSKNGSSSDIPASDIYAIDGAKHNALHIIYSVGGNAAAVLGGYTDGYDDPDRLKFGDDGITLVTVDEGRTYAVEISGDMTVKSAECYMGEAFGADCLGFGAMIGQLPDNGGITAYKNGTYISTVSEGGSGTDESARSIAWSDNGVAFVVAEQGKTARLLYGFDMSGDEPAPADVTSDYIYTDRLSAAGDLLVGLKAEPTPDGERAGLRLSLYRYDSGLKETAYSIIELDKDTSRDNLKYLSSPAESNSSFIAVDGTGTLFAVPTVYFDGFSEVERIVVLRFDGSVFTQIGEHLMYDEKSSVLCPVFSGGNLYIITDTKLVTLALPES